MSAQSPFPTTPAALAAFLRGVERRGLLLAELQAGDAQAGDAALAAAMERFLAGAADRPIAQWPRAFWAGLLAEPALRVRGAAPAGLDGPLRHLGTLGTGPRAALLLRLVAGLEEDDAAAVLGLSRPTYRLALQRALPHRGDGAPDPQAWQALDAQVQAWLRTPDAPRLQRLAQARAAVRDPRPARPVAAEAVAADGPPRRLLAVLRAALGACALAMLATFVWPGGGPDVAQARIEALPPADAPASTLDAEAAHVAHPDFDLIADPEGQRLAQDADFAAWLAARSAAGAGLEAALAPVPPVEDAEPVTAPSDLPESSDAPL